MCLYIYIQYTYGYIYIYMYDFKQGTETFTLKLLFMLEGALKVVPFVLQGARNNWYGWGCPSYCQEPGWSLLALTLIFGLLFGLCLATLGLWTVWSHLNPPSCSAVSERPSQPSSSQPRHSALAGYVDAFKSPRRRSGGTGLHGGGI
jgi:hypothetical protein